jgi:hypothetical protein
MSGLDSLLSKALSSTMESNLDKSMLEKVEQRLIEKYGITLAQSIEDFPKLDTILREFFGDRADRMERHFLGNIINMQESQAPSTGWIAIDDSSLTKLILETLADEDKKNIINSVTDESHVISEIIENAKISQTSGYRKVNFLIDTGFLIEDGNITAPGGKKVSKYKSVLENVKIYIKKNKVAVRVKLTEESIHQSALMKVVCYILNPR